MFVDATDNGGYACNDTADLTEAELAPAPGSYESCTDPLLRVEAQVLLVVNDSDALDFMDMVYQGIMVDSRHQALQISRRPPG